MFTLQERQHICGLIYDQNGKDDDTLTAQVENVRSIIRKSEK